MTYVKWLLLGLLLVGATSARAQDMTALKVGTIMNYTFTEPNGNVTFENRVVTAVRGASIKMVSTIKGPRVGELEFNSAGVYVREWYETFESDLGGRAWANLPHTLGKRWSTNYSARGGPRGSQERSVSCEVKQVGVQKMYAGHTFLASNVLCTDTWRSTGGSATIASWFGPFGEVLEQTRSWHGGSSSVVLSEFSVPAPTLPKPSVEAPKVGTKPPARVAANAKP